MLSHLPQQSTAAALRRYLWALEEERLEALARGLGANDLYMRDLERDIRDTREAYVGHAVTEIALLRADLDGRLNG